MKTMKLAIAAATILAVCAGTTWTVAAETSPAQAPARGKAPCRWTDGKAMNADYHLAKMTERFKLSDEQKTKIKPILDENYKQQQAVRADQKLTRDQRRAKMQELRTQLHEKIKPILTPEQYKLAAERWSAAGKHRQYHHGKRFKRTGYHAGHYRLNPDEHLAKMTECLKLSDEQKTKIKPILDENYKQQQAVRADQKLTRDQRRAKMQELRTQLHDKIKPILTPEQLHQYNVHKGAPNKSYRGKDCPFSR